MLFRFHDACTGTEMKKKDWASSCKMQVNADRLFSLAQKDQATPVVKVFCWDAQLCRHARIKTHQNKKASCTRAWF